MSIRAIREVEPARPAVEGAGVHLRRAFGFGADEDLDPFLLFDDFRGDRPADWKAGFPWHPHRGIETVTYVLAGEVEHSDSLGNRGVMGPGDLQWMTAGRGIIHQEMPRGDVSGRMHGFQLWANLPSSRKLCTPRYQDISAPDIPLAGDGHNLDIRVLCGTFGGRKGPVEGLAADPVYLDVRVFPGREARIPLPVDHHAFAYVFEGEGSFLDASEPRGVLVEDLARDVTLRMHPARNRHLVRFDSGDEVRVQAGGDGLRFLLAAGAPLGEPVAWHGPLVMNTPAEIETALQQLRDGTFLGP